MHASTRLQLSYQQQSPQDDIKPDASSNTTSVIRSTEEKERTLYEVLGASPTASRSELKRQYVKLARVSHPDAQIGGTTESNDVDFQEIAEAWKTLGNEKTRRRYDRELKAKEWGEKAQRFTNEGLEQVAPVASKIMDNVAVPFLRRTSATIAFGKNIASGLLKKMRKRVQTALRQLFQFQNVAISLIFPLQLISKPILKWSPVSQVLAREEAEKAKYIVEALDSVKNQRLFATLQSPELALTSKEAEEVLEKLSSEDTVSFVNRGMKKTAIEKEIQSLRKTETQFTERLEIYNEIDREWNAWLNKQEEARQDLREKKQKETEARKAFNDAQQMVVKAKDDMLSVTNTLRGVEQEVRKSAQEMDRVSTTLSRKQERVQNALRRKTELMKGAIQVEYITEQEVMLLRRKETQLMGESKQIATMVARLQSRADKLKKRAEALEQWRNNS
eukprot:jgi/Psemu1/258113/estExt_Genewise1Plus.C_2610026